MGVSEVLLCTTNETIERSKIRPDPTMSTLRHDKKAVLSQR